MLRAFVTIPWRCLCYSRYGWSTALGNERLLVVSGILRKCVAFARWLFASESLPEPSGESSHTHTNRTGFTRWLFEGATLDAARREGVEQTPPKRFLRWVMSAESLPVPPRDSVDARKRGPGFWIWLASGDQLGPADSGTRVAIPRTDFLRSILSSESCPVERAPSRRASGVNLRRLFAPEECPTRQAPLSRAKPGFLHWLLSPESCPRYEGRTCVRSGGFLRWLFARDKL